MKILSGLDELEGKTIKVVKHYNADGYEALFITEDDCVLSLNFQETNDYDVEYVACKVDMDEYSIYENHEDSLLYFNVITSEEAKEFEEERARKEEELRVKVDENIKRARYEAYLKLKDEFEVNYKL